MATQLWSPPPPAENTQTDRRFWEIIVYLCTLGYIPKREILQIFCVIQLGIFGWQMAAIKYEKDRAANTLLPNYNTYGRYDIPSYYESYWQSPEERYYTGRLLPPVNPKIILVCQSCMDA